MDHDRIDHQREMPLGRLIPDNPTPRRKIGERVRKALAGRQQSDEIGNAARRQLVSQRFTQQFVQAVPIEFAMLGGAEFIVAEQPQGPDLLPAIGACHELCRILLLVLVPIIRGMYLVLSTIFRVSGS